MKGKWAGWVLVVDTSKILATDGLGFRGGWGKPFLGWRCWEAIALVFARRVQFCSRWFWVGMRLLQVETR